MNRRDFLKLSVGGLILSQVPLIKANKLEIINKPKIAKTPSVIKIASLPLEEYGNRVPAFSADVVFSSGIDNFLMARVDLPYIHISDIREQLVYGDAKLHPSGVEYSFGTYQYFCDVILALPNDTIFVNKLFADRRPFTYKTEIIDGLEFAYIKLNEENKIQNIIV